MFNRKNAMYIATENENIEIIKILLSIPSINVDNPSILFNIFNIIFG